MIFLVDLENVGSEGLRGARYLSWEDEVIIFYSQVCEKVQQGYLHQLMEACCRWEICKLKKTGKNALDFISRRSWGRSLGGDTRGRSGSSAETRDISRCGTIGRAGQSLPER